MSTLYNGVTKHDRCLALYVWMYGGRLQQHSAGETTSSMCYDPWWTFAMVVLAKLRAGQSLRVQP